jgi:hypothetical protein
MVTTAGAETLPWLASCVVLPASLAFFVAYGRLVEALPAQSVFYAAGAARASGRLGERPGQGRRRGRGQEAALRRLFYRARPAGS